jgi:hypothetical protein
MMIGAYQNVDDFAYPGWRLTVPGGPAGGHYKGFTHAESTGTTILPQDDYEADRGDGMSSHDAVHASRRNPRGIYRSSGEVPPRPNASGAAHTYASFQTRRHAGTSVAPGSFPADFKETNEDDFLSLAENAPHYFTPNEIAAGLLGEYELGLVCRPGGPIFENFPPNTVAVPVATSTPPPATGATSVVAQPAPVAPTPVATVPVYTAPPVSPAPAPVVATNEVVPLNDGSGNYVNISTGAIVSPSQVSQNLATMQIFTASAAAGQLIPQANGTYLNPQTGAIIPGAAIAQSAAAVPATASPTAAVKTWLEAPSFISSAIPNWGLVAAAGVAFLLMGGKRR